MSDGVLVFRRGGVGSSWQREGQMPGPGDDDEPIGFELSEEDLEAIADQPSELVPDEPSPTETPYTIRNAPVAKSILPPEAFLRELEPAEDEGREDDRGESTDDDEP